MLACRCRCAKKQSPIPSQIEKKKLHRYIYVANEERKMNRQSYHKPNHLKFQALFHASSKIVRLHFC